MTRPMTSNVFNSKFQLLLACNVTKYRFYCFKLKIMDTNLRQYEIRLWSTDHASKLQNYKSFNDNKRKNKMLTISEIGSRQTPIFFFQMINAKKPIKKLTTKRREQRHIYLKKINMSTNSTLGNKIFPRTNASRNA